jgi:hypothetical protein
MDYSFPYINYYSSKFVDPLYQPYRHRTFQPINRYMENENEFNFGKGLTYKKQFVHQPCQPGYVPYGIDYCKPDMSTSAFYTSDVHTLDSIRPGLETYSLDHDNQGAFDW